MIHGAKIKKDFPQLSRVIDGKPLVYLDSTATSLKPAAVIEKINDYYRLYTANIFRGIYKTSEEATREYEEARKKVAVFIGAKDVDEVVFTRNTTESINLVVSGLSDSYIKKGDVVAVTIMEHHSNFVPWQQLAFKKDLGFRIWDRKADGTLDLGKLDKIITRKTKVLAISALSNVLGTINPIKKIVKAVKRLNPECLVLVDAAQSAPHMKTDVVDWGADFVVFSSHKMLGPTGVGVLWGKRELLEKLPPYQYGGEMITEVYRDKSLFKPIPHKFEAGTPHIAGVIGLGAAVDYLMGLGMTQVRVHEEEIVSYALDELKKVEGLIVYGPTDPKIKGGVIAFTLKNAHPHDIAQILDEDNICVRAGNHCAMPLHIDMGVSATARASFYVYTTRADVDALVKGLMRVNKMFS